MHLRLQKVEDYFCIDNYFIGMFLRYDSFTVHVYNTLTQW